MPLIKSDKFPVDCLFFIFEQDFELYRDGGVDGSPDSLGTNTATLGKSSASSSSAVPDPRGQKRKESSERNEVYDRSAASDRVKIVNAASRKGVGDLVCGWDTIRLPNPEKVGQLPASSSELS